MSDDSATKVKVSEEQQANIAVCGAIISIMVEDGARAVKGTTSPDELLRRWRNGAMEILNLLKDIQ